MSILQTMQTNQANHVAAGHTAIQSATYAEGIAIKGFTTARRQLFHNASYHMTRFIREGNRSMIMKTIHSLGDVMDANAEEVNGALSSFAAGMTQNTFVWSSKEQSSLAIMVKAGEKSGMSGDAGFHSEFHGFSEDKLKTFLMTQTKQDWGKRGAGVVMSQISELLETLMRAPGVEFEATNLGRHEPRQYGSLAYKSIWRGVGSIASKAAYYQEYTSVVLEDGVPTVTTKKLDKLESRLHEMETDSSAIAGNIYAQDLQDEIDEYKHKLDVWEAAAGIWEEKLGGLVAEWNDIQVWMSPEPDPIQLPTGELQAMHEWQNKSTLTNMANVVESMDVQEFNKRLSLSAEEARAKLSELFA